MTSGTSSTLHRGERSSAGLALTVLLPLLGVAGCATQQERVSQKEDTLAAAGFIVRPANTPERQAMLNRLPAHHFVQRVHGDTVSYVYADPLVCHCLYVGSQQAYGQYRQNAQQQKLADEQATTAQMYSDPSWSWGAWGPGFGPGFGPGPGW
jgi:hypothetical protein